MSCKETFILKVTRREEEEDLKIKKMLGKNVTGEKIRPTKRKDTGKKIRSMGNNIRPNGRKIRPTGNNIKFPTG